MRIAIATDAWSPQTNGVVTTLRATAGELTARGHEVSLLTPEGLASVPCPTYPEVRLALCAGRHASDWLERVQPDALHIATEGPIGLAVRGAARRGALRFTTSYHTRFPQYLRARLPIPEACSYAWLRWFQSAAARTLVGTRDVHRELRRQGFRGLARWGRGVDTDLFRPVVRERRPGASARLLYVGRVAIEKGVEDFCRVAVPGEKIVVGDGPQRVALAARYPSVRFLGYRHGAALAAVLADADCLVFPSRTDTFGLVMLEAMAAGVPVAAYPVTGPIDVVRPGVSGCLHENLAIAIGGALRLGTEGCRRQALEFSWARSTAEFLGHLVDARGRPGRSSRWPSPPV